MSRYLRMTNWSQPAVSTVTTVVEEDDLASGDVFDAVESVLADGFFVTYEVFDADSLMQATMIGAARAKGEEVRERHMAVAYFHYLTTLPMVVEGGLLLATEPAPLSREDMAWVLRSVAHHESYRRQRIEMPLADGTTITMNEGEVLPG